MTNPKVRRKMSMQFNSVVRTIGPIRNTSKSPTTSENPSTVGLPTRHHQRHDNRLFETRNPGVMRRNTVRVRRSVSSAAGVVERVTLPGSAHQGMIVRTWMKSEQRRSSDADSDLFGLDWGDDPIATINSVTERNDRTRGGKRIAGIR